MTFASDNPSMLCWGDPKKNGIKCVSLHMKTVTYMKFSSFTLKQIELFYILEQTYHLLWIDFSLQFPIEMSMPWILTDHILRTKEPSMME
jgi:hypothetical protein